MHSRAHALRLLVPLATLLTLGVARAQEGSWCSGFHLSDLDERALGMTPFDLGAGPRLAVVGEFEHAGGIAVHHVAAWDGAHWTPLGSGFQGVPAHPVCVLPFDDGGGADLYVAGRFQNAGGLPAVNVARWDGSAWSALGAGAGGIGEEILALSAYDDGHGAALYVAGELTSAGGQPAGHIARWDGAGWSALGAGLDDDVTALAVFDDGQGSELYAGGFFTNAGSGPAPGIARWNGSAWSALEPNVECGIGALQVFDNGTGPALYAAGTFSPPGGAPRHGVARWRFGGWRFAANLGPVAQPHAFAVLDPGPGLASGLYLAGGNFKGGAIWQPLASFPYFLASSYPNDPSDMNVLAATDLGQGPRLFAGGWFSAMRPEATSARPVPALNVAAWDGSDWSRMGSGGQGLDEWVESLATLPNAQGGDASVAALGYFTLAGDQFAAGAARWTGSAWELLGDGSPDVHVVLADPAGAGAFFAAVGYAVRHWDGAGWSDLPGLQGSIRALALHDGGAGPELLVAGDLEVGGAAPHQALARWDGASWHDLGLQGDAVALTSWVPTSGAAPLLAVAGDFDTPLLGSGVALQQGGVWTLLGGGTVQGSPRALAALPTGSGQDLVLGGNFSAVAGVPAHSIARWNGSAWSELGYGVAGEVRALALREAGALNELVVAGDFERVGNLRAANIARWNGSTWSVLGPQDSNGTNARVHALTVVGPRVFAGGAFDLAGGQPAAHFACWEP